MEEGGVKRKGLEPQVEVVGGMKRKGLKHPCRARW